MAVVSIQEYAKALSALEKAVTLTESHKNDLELYKLNRDGSIQRFEFCVELAWKVSVKEMGTNTTSPKTALREMLQNKLISNFDAWFEFVVARNKSSHTYDEDIAAQVYSVAVSFLNDGKSLLEAFKKL